MDLQLHDSPRKFLCVTYGVVGIFAALTVLARHRRGPNLDAIPTVGSNTWLGSCWDGFRYSTNARNIIDKGYKKYKRMPFKVAAGMYHWMVILSDRTHIEELARASDDDFSLLEAADDQLQFRSLMGTETCDDPYHIGILQPRLARNLPSLCPMIRDEIVASFDDILDLRASEWKSVPVLSAMEKIVCRASNRAFVGLPLCRDAEWIDLNIRCTVDFIKGGSTVRFFPAPMRSLAGRYLTNIPWCMKRGAKLLGSIIEERQKYISEYGAEWDNNPNDLVSWLMEEAKGPELTVERLTNRILLVNLSAIHTSASSFSQALLRLAENPQYIQPLREEVEGVVEKDGWTKVALSNMRKIDSFLMECQRIEGLNIVTLSRKAQKDYTFSDGTLIPKGILVSVPSLSLHRDRNIYTNPEVFEPFRFRNLHEEDGKHSLTSTTTEYLAFGHGKHACPGRFFVGDEMKCMLAHTVVTYDVKLEDNAKTATSFDMNSIILVDRDAKIMFRNRGN